PPIFTHDSRCVENSVEAAPPSRQFQIAPPLLRFIDMHIRGASGGHASDAIIRTNLMYRRHRAGYVDQVCAGLSCLAHQPIVPIAASNREWRNFTKQPTRKNKNVASGSRIHSALRSRPLSQLGRPAISKRHRVIDAAIEAACNNEKLLVASSDRIDCWQKIVQKNDVRIDEC